MPNNILNGGFLNAIFLASPTPSIAPSSYNSATLYGNSIVDNLRILDIFMDDSELASLSKTDTYNWDSNTLLLVPFQQSLSGGNANVLPEDDSTYDVYRKRTGDDNFILLSEGNDISNSEYDDYEAVKINDYVYKLFFKFNDDTISPSVESESVEICYWYWVLIDSVTGESYYFRLDVNSSDASVTTDFTVLDNGFSRLPAVITSDKKYDTNTISARMGYVNSSNEYIDTVALLENMRSFMVNGNKKILKDPKGNIKKVNTSNFTYNFEDPTSQQMTTISFTYTETGDIK